MFGFTTYTVSELEDDLTGALHGTSLNKVQNRYSAYWRAARTFMNKLDAPDTRRIVGLTNPIHDSVFDYALPSDFKAVIDIRPQVNRELADNFNATGSESFDLMKELTRGRGKLAIKDNNGTKSIRISRSVSSKKVVINSMQTLTDNGTWAAVGSATGLASDTLYYVSGSRSIIFDLVATGDGISNTTMNSVDLTDHDEVGSIFVWVYFPSVSTVTGITLRWGNDITTNYWSRTVTAQHDGTALQAGWNLLKFDWNGATETGTVAPATIDSLRLTVASSSALNNIRVDNIFASIGYIYEIEYYSKYLFRDTSGTYKNKPTDSSDIVNLDEEGLNLYFYEVLKVIGQQTQGEDSTFDIGISEKELDELYRQYRGKYPSQRLKERETWYRIK